jgi:hypothetical protein
MAHIDQKIRKEPLFLSRRATSSKISETLTPKGALLPVYR